MDASGAGADNLSLRGSREREDDMQVRKERRDGGWRKGDIVQSQYQKISLRCREGVVGQGLLARQNAEA